MSAAADILKGIRARQDEKKELSEEETIAAKVRTTTRLDRIKAALSDPSGIDGCKFDRAMEAVEQEDNQ